MFKVFLIGIVVFLIGVTLLLPWYLGPDDLSACADRPDSMSSQCAPADAIVAISGGDTAARTAEAVRLYQLGWASKLIFSGAASDVESPSNAAAMKLQAVKAGVRPDDITVEEFARDTEENAERIRQITADETPERLILVTSAYHQRRASIEFRHTFTAGTDIINHPVPSDKQWSSAWWLTPSGWWLAGSELIKIFSLSVRGVW